MRNAIHSIYICVLSILALANSQLILPFNAPLLALPQISPNILDSIVHDVFGLRKRATTCQKNYLSCDYMSVSGYCCPSNAQCAIDGVGHVACCPVGAACTGTVSAGGFATQQVQQQTTNAIAGGVGGVVTASPAISASYVPDSSTGAGGTFVANTATASAAATVSYVANAYYPFKIIPTTYQNAQGCSAAWTGCQTDLATCTNYLAGSAVTGGAAVGGSFATISAPNMVATGVQGQQVQLPALTTTFAMPTAQAICSSLSSVACSGLQVSACSVFGNGVGNAAPTRGCGAVYGAGFGVAVGMAGGQLLW